MGRMRKEEEGGKERGRERVSRMRGKRERGREGGWEGRRNEGME